MHSRFVVVFAVAISTAALLSRAQTVTQNLPEPLIANTLVTGAQCAGQDEASQGFRLLFDGTLTSFQKNFATYKGGNSTNTDIDTRYVLCPAESTICTAAATSDLRTQFQVTDFDWRLTYRNNGNEGIYYKSLTNHGTTNYGSEWDTGIEFAIDDASSSKTIAGSVFDMWAANPYTYQKFSTGKWNTVRIVQKGDSVQHWMNNTMVAHYQFWDANWNTAMANSKWAGSTDLAQNTSGCKCKVSPGWVGFQGDHAGNWHIKNFRINTTVANIKLGPVNCGTPVKEGDKVSFTSTERLPGALRLNFKEAIIARAEVVGADGKAAAMATVENGGASLLIRNWKQSGVYFLRAFSAKGQAARPEKIFLP